MVSKGKEKAKNWTTAEIHTASIECGIEIEAKIPLIASR